ncbi:MAG: ABC transporter permease [Microbacteriaceae bacterium]|nr:ABC transporter permease [Microbacteriaceae bacterium]
MSVIEPTITSPIAKTVSDGWIATRRNVYKLRRDPEIFIFSLIQPIMFVLLFNYVFAGAIQVEGGDYTQFLMAGIFAQTIVLSSTYSGSAMAQDLKDGIIDRFRTLPMSSAAVLIGRTFGDLVINSSSLIVMMITGFVIGWRIDSSLPEAALAILLLLFFSYAFSWVMALIGMSVRSPEIINNVSFLVLFPMTFLSNAFVPSETLPGPLRVFAEWNPVSALIQATRELFGNIPVGIPTGDSWLQQNPITTVFIALVLMLLIFIPLSIRKFKSISSR